MIKKLKVKFVLISMLSVAVVMVLVVGSINLINYFQNSHNDSQLLQYISENDGVFPDRIEQLPPDNREQRVDRPMLDNKETRYKTRYFAVVTDDNNSITEVKTDYIAAITADQATEYAKSVISGGKDSGTYGVYRYIVTDKSYGRLIVFLDCEQSFSSQSKLLLISLLIAGASLLVVFVLVSAFSGRAIRPVAESFEKQKRFITDASHEIKTPLAIISANADVLQLTDPDNEWIYSIKNQIKRLTQLVNNLVSLTRLDEQRQLTSERFNISDAVYDAVAPFEILAQQQAKHFTLSIEPDIEYTGDEAGLRQLVSILADNAIKYATDGGNVDVSLAQRGKGVVMCVKNTGEHIDKKELDCLFDRFYRADGSRARQTGGFGIGLSIAKAIVTAHRGKITAACDENNVISFTVTLTK